MTDQQKTQEQLEVFSTAFQSGRLKSLRHMLNGLPHQQIAHLIESSPPKLREALWKIISDKHHGDIIAELSEEIQAEFLEGKDAQEVVRLTSNLDSDDIADILQQLPDRIIPQVLAAMDEQNRKRIESIIHFDEDSAAGLMDLDTICVRPRLTLDVVQRYLRLLGSLPRSTDHLFVINRNNEFLGLLPISRILTADPDSTVRELMVSDVKTIDANMPSREVALLFERYDWISAPVIDADKKLLGRITIDDVVDVIREGAEHSMLSMAGLDEDQDTFAPAIKTTLDRAVWLGINLLTAFLAASTIKIFEDTIEKVVALAVLMPIVAGMGGVAGSQTLTIIIRAIALDQVGSHNRNWLLQREFIAATLNGLLWAIVAGTATALWFHDIKLAWIIGAAMIINLASASLAGTLLPLFFKRFNIDPALGSSMALTTITDVVGFLSFLGLATYFTPDDVQLARQTCTLHDEAPSKTQRKKELLAIRDLSAQLCSLGSKALAKIPLDPQLRDSIVAAQNMPQDGARKRQIQYIAKLMRDADIPAIKSAYLAATQRTQQEKHQHHKLEALREDLIARGDAAVEDVMAAYPQINRQQLRQYVRGACKERELNKTPVQQRKLLRYLREFVSKKE